MYTVYVEHKCNIILKTTTVVVFTWAIYKYLYVNYTVAEITNSPVNTKVCSGDIVNIPCGFTSSDPAGVIIQWRRRIIHENGNVVEKNITAFNIIDKVDDLQWFFFLNNSKNSYLSVGPVNETHDQSTYQCIISKQNGNIIVSNTGTLTVAGERVCEVHNLNALYVYVSWSLYVHLCVHVCVCVCVCNDVHCMCVCVCVYEREKKRDCSRWISGFKK